MHTQRTCTHTTHMPAPLHRHPSACGCACAGQARAAGRHGGEQPAVRAGDGQAAPANARADGALTRRPSSGGGWLLLLLLWWWWCLFCIAACVGWLLDRRCHRFTQFKPQCAFSPTRSFPFPSFGLAVTCLYFSLSLSLSLPRPCGGSCCRGCLKSAQSTPLHSAAHNNNNSSSSSTNDCIFSHDHNHHCLACLIQLWWRGWVDVVTRGERREESCCSKVMERESRW